MTRWWARRRLHSLPLFLQAVLVGAGFSAHAASVWLGVFCAAALLNLWAWIVALRWRRAILDTPTSRVASAAQGFVELIGVAQPLADTRLLSPFTQLPCLWYRYTLEQRENGEWRQVEEGESDMPFNLDDDSGRCELDPVGAEILTTHQETRTQDDQRYTEHVLLKGEPLYALGEFVSCNGAQSVLDTRLDVGDLLAEWKSDQAALHDRFDLDRSGAIDATEWQLARQAAEREVARRHQAIRNQPTRHQLRKPGANQPYLIANYSPDKLGRRYTWLSALYLTLLLSSLFGIGWAMHLTD
jgi:hypothetical protein